MGRNRITVVTSLGLVAVAALLVLVGSVGLGRLRVSTDNVQQASARVSAYQAVQRALAGEGLAESAFHLSPSDANRLDLFTSLAELEVALDEVRRTGTAQDRATAARLQVLHRTRASALAVSRPTGAAPELPAMQALLDEAQRDAASDLEAAFENQHAVVTRMAWRAPLVLTVSFALLLLCWVWLVRHGQRATERAAASEQLALEDPLTGLGNRRAFEHALAPELAKEDSDSVVLLLDLDGFKEINDTWGHDIGDHVLKTVAERLTETVRGTDVVARLGGDEFAVLARPAAHAEVLRERLHAAVGQPLKVRDVVLQPGSSIGIATVVAGSQQEEVLRAADASLYARKRERAALRLLAQRRGDTAEVQPRQASAGS